jgi:hypothetical protein
MGVKRIEELTEEQKAQIPGWVDKWTKIGLQTGEADWPTFEEAVPKCYRFADLEPPEMIVRASSPIVVSVVGPVVDAFLTAGASDMKALDELCNRVSSLDTDEVKKVVRQLVEGLKIPEGEVGVDALVESVRRQWHLVFGGQLWVAWQAYSSFFRDVCHLELEGDLWDRDRAYADAESSVCWWWPHRRYVVAATRPVRISLDNDGRLHDESQKAIEWPDGWGVFRWHGVAVPPYVITNPETITVSKIEGESNVEVRRIMLERYGPEKYIKDAGAEEVHRDEFGVLYRKDLEGDEPIIMVEVEDSYAQGDGTRHKFMLRIDPQCRPMLANGEYGEPQDLTARNAVASTFGKRGEEYAPEKEA